MNVLTAVKERYSVRNYKNEPVKPEDLAQILEAAKLAPTAKNLQPFHIYVLQSEEAMTKINANCRCVFGAPSVFMITYKKEESWKSPFNEGYRSGEMDATIIADEMMLTAWSLGVGTCWVKYFDYEKIKEVFELPEDETVALLMPFGYPSEDAAPIPMHFASKEIGELVTML